MYFTFRAKECINGGCKIPEKIFNLFFFCEFVAITCFSAAKSLQSYPFYLFIVIENIWNDMADEVRSELAERLTPIVSSAGTTENDVQNTRKHVIPENHLETQMLEKPIKNDQAEYSGETTLPKNSIFFPPIK